MAVAALVRRSSQGQSAQPLLDGAVSTVARDGRTVGRHSCHLRLPAEQTGAVRRALMRDGDRVARRDAFSDTSVTSRSPNFFGRWRVDRHAMLTGPALGRPVPTDGRQATADLRELPPGGESEGSRHRHSMRSCGSDWRTESTRCPFCDEHAIRTASARSYRGQLERRVGCVAAAKGHQTSTLSAVRP